MNQMARYQITGELGHGGMAQVYRAYDPRFERDVAIKMMAAPFLRDQSFRRRFEREAKLIASLEHPAIVPVYDFGEQNSQPYLVMRLMAGGSLVERLLKGPFSLSEAAQLLTRLAPALDVAHSSGIVHRDLKPGNILFDQHHNAYISDFGIAKLINQTSMGSQSGIMGTPAYMSPEQVRGEKLDGRSDIYALGVILFQMLSGKLPYDADTPFGLAYKHVTEPIPSLLAVRPDLPQACQTVIMRAMAKDRSQRYTTAKEMAHALNAIAMGQHAAHHYLSHPSREVPVLPTAARGRYRERPVKEQTGTVKRWWRYLAVLASTMALLVGVGIMTTVMISDRETITPTTIVLNEGTNGEPSSQPSGSDEPTALPIAPTATQMPTETPTSTPLPPTNTPLPPPTSTPVSPPISTSPPPTQGATIIQTVEVLAELGWQNTNVGLQIGDQVVVEYISGRWTNWVSQNEPFDGNSPPQRYTCTDYFRADECVEPFASFPQGALIGRVDSQLLGIGNRLAFTAQSTTLLELRMNDGDVGLYDNAGSIIVRITVQRP